MSSTKLLLSKLKLRTKPKSRIPGTDQDQHHIYDEIDDTVSLTKSTQEVKTFSGSSTDLKLKAVKPSAKHYSKKDRSILDLHTSRLNDYEDDHEAPKIPDRGYLKDEEFVERELTQSQKSDSIVLQHISTSRVDVSETDKVYQPLIPPKLSDSGGSASSVYEPLRMDKSDAGDSTKSRSKKRYENCDIESSRHIAATPTNYGLESSPQNQHQSLSLKKHMKRNSKQAEGAPEIPERGCLKDTPPVPHRSYLKDVPPIPHRSYLKDIPPIPHRSYLEDEEFVEKELNYVETPINNNPKPSMEHDQEKIYQPLIPHRLIDIDSDPSGESNYMKINHGSGGK